MKEGQSHPLIASFSCFIWISLACFFTASAFHCMASDGVDDGPGPVTPGPVDPGPVDPGPVAPGFEGHPLIYEIVRQSLQNWEINLKVEQIRKSRNPGGTLTAANPPNWITVAPRSAICDVPGLPNRCQVQPDSKLLGVCIVRTPFSANGEIIDTTLVVALEGILDGVNVKSKESITGIFSHEIGHCLGLQHWGDKYRGSAEEEPGTASDHQKHLMYPTATSVFVPHEKELAALKAVYNTEDGCSQDGGICVDPQGLPNSSSCNSTNIDYGEYENYHPCYFTRTDIYRKYHKKFPEFTLFASAGSEIVVSPEEEMPPPGPSFDEPITTHVYALYADGIERVYTTHP